MNSPEELVREYSAWALGRIGGRLARQVLEANSKRELCEAVKREIEMALAKAE